MLGGLQWTSSISTGIIQDNEELNNLTTQFNYTGSLDIIRTSPDHGTAYDIVNSNKANANSLYLSFKVADMKYKNRIKK